MSPSVSIVIPVYNEGDAVTPTLEAVLHAVADDAEVLVVYDMPEDTTVPVLDRLCRDEPRLRAVHNTLGPGPANAIRFGLDQAKADVAVVTMADSSDEPDQIESLAQLVREGAVVAAASRYMKGGRQIGGPLVKRTLSRLAGNVGAIVRRLVLNIVLCELPEIPCVVHHVGADVVVVAVVTNSYRISTDVAHGVVADQIVARVRFDVDGVDRRFFAL